MEKFKSILKEIYSLSDNILKKCITLMETLNYDQNNILDDVLLNSKENITEENALKILRDISLKMVKDAKKVKKEFYTFKSQLKENIENYDTEEEYMFRECPLFERVWRGDEYDEGTLEGLILFRDDLKEQLSNTNEEYLIDRCLNNI